jgi:cytochrome c oxidase subunit IV
MTDVATNVGPGAEADHDATHHASDWLYVQIFVILVMLTAAEVSTYVIELGNALLPALIVMMVIKFALVVMFFMHLRFDHKLFSWVFVSGLVLAVLVYIAMLAMFRYWQDL